jgi:hypothetical protein
MYLKLMQWMFANGVLEATSLPLSKPCKLAAMGEL